MASYSVATAELGVRSKTLVASTVDTVTFGRDCDEVEVVNVNGAAAIYFTVDGSTPVAGGNGSYELPAAVGALRVEVPTAGSTVVKVVSSGAPAYSVTGSLR